VRRQNDRWDRPTAAVKEAKEWPNCSVIRLNY